MIKFDFTSHFIIVLCLMVILVSTLIVINSSVNSKWGMGPFMYFVQGPPVNMLRHCPKAMIKKRASSAESSHNYTVIST